MTINESALPGYQGAFWGQPERWVSGAPGLAGLFLHHVASALWIRTSKLWFFKERNVKSVLFFFPSALKIKWNKTKIS